MRTAKTDVQSGNPLLSVEVATQVKTFQDLNEGRDAEVFIRYFRENRRTLGTIQRKEYRETFVINPVHLLEVTELTPPNIEHLVAPVSQAAEKLSRAIDGDRWLRIKTYSENRDHLDRLAHRMREDVERFRRQIEGEDTKPPE